ncbi:MAG: hypothetical protein JXM70_01170 [Pirellulales bacterium]|nr:hypothetical protein [Pirellulales bacterium]
MTCRRFAFIAIITMMIPMAAPGTCEAFEFLHRLHHSAALNEGAMHSGPRYQQTSRWYPEYRPLAGDDYGGGVPTYAYGYFGARSHSSYGCHYGYYGDLYTWGPLRGR